MAGTIEDLKNNINLVRYNPAGIQQVMYDLIEEASNGTLDVVDPTNPFVFQLEAAAVLSAAIMEEGANLNRQQYPSVAVTEDELYLHMSDQDYLGRFANPSRTVFTLLLNKDELINRAVAVDNSGVRKLTIPRNTEFTVADYTFTMEYPIDLRVLAHGGIQVIYDVSQPSPVQTLPSNNVDWRIGLFRGEEFVILTIPVNQMTVQPKYVHLYRATNYSTTIDLKDKYYYCRAYRPTDTGEWFEIRTTHTEQVYDPLTPTLVLRAYQNQLVVTVPQVYVSNGSLDTEIRIDIYTTKGALNLILDTYEINSFNVNWRDIDNQGLDKYSSPLQAFNTMAIYSDAVVTGGTDGLDFETLRERVIMNAIGNAQLPITEAQLNTRLANSGYRAIKDVDNITNRVFLACRRLPPPRTKQTSSAAPVIIGSVQGTFEFLKTFKGVIDNTTQITITPDTWFSRNNGIVAPVVDQVREGVEELSGQALITYVNENRLLHSPFHYVLDAIGNYFDARVYYMDDPSILRREFVEENIGLNISISSNLVGIFRTETGYRLQVQTSSGSGIRGFADNAVIPQLSFRPVGEQRDVYITGDLVQRTDEGERVFEFLIDTRFQITAGGQISLTNWTSTTNDIVVYQADLSQTFNLLYYVVDAGLAGLGFNLEYRLDNPDLPLYAVGVTHEHVIIEFGQYLDAFWHNYRSIASAEDYLTYETDVLDVYDENIYERDPNTGAVKVSLDSKNNLKYNIIHRKGDPILNSRGERVIRHREGDIVLDSSGNPIVRTQRQILRELDMFFHDAKYLFATDEDNVEYLGEIPRTLVSWINQDLADFQKQTLEQTQILLYPLRTMGYAEVIVGENTTVQVTLEQSMSVTFYLTRTKYEDSFVRSALETLATATLSEAFQSSRITINNIVSKMTAQAGTDAIAIDVSGLGGDADYQALTMVNDSERCAIAKTLTLGLDGKYRVVDAISITFVRHEA